MSKKSILIYAFLFFLILLTRLWKIDHLPSVISHDEIFYPTQAKTLAVSGYGANGKWTPLEFSPENKLYAELPGFIMSFAAKVFPNQTIFAARITHAFLGSLLVFILAAIAYELSKNRKVAIATMVLAAFNPWLFQFSRMGFDSLFSLFFYTSGLLFFIKNKKYAKLWSLPLFILGFLQYQGLKVIFLPLILLTTLFNLLKDNEFKISKLQEILKKNIPSLIVLISAVIIFIVYLFKVQTQGASERLNFFVWNDEKTINQMVNVARQQGFNSSLSNVYPNKITVIIEKLAEQYFNSLDLKQWFFSLEVVRNPFAVYQHGLFYWLDLPLIIWGLIVVFNNKKNKKIGLFLASLAIIAPLPSAIVSTGSWLVFRSSFLVPIFLILMGFAVNDLFEKWPKKSFFVFATFYLILIARFLYQYFYVYPISGTRDQYFAEKIIAQYIKRNPDKKIIITAPEPIFVFQEILIYNNLINKENIKDINQAFNTENYQLTNFKVLGERCVPEIIENDTIYISHSNSRPCSGDDSPLKYTQIPSLIDGGGIYRIYNDLNCANFGLSRFPSIREDLFDLDKLSSQEFCENFIVRN